MISHRVTVTGPHFTGRRRVAANRPLVAALAVAVTAAAAGATGLLPAQHDRSTWFSALVVAGGSALYAAAATWLLAQYRHGRRSAGRLAAAVGWAAAARAVIAVADAFGRPSDPSGWPDAAMLLARTASTVALWSTAAALALTLLLRPPGDRALRTAVRTGVALALGSRLVAPALGDLAVGRWPLAAAIALVLPGLAVTLAGAAARRPWLRSQRLRVGLVRAGAVGATGLIGLAGCAAVPSAARPVAVTAGLLAAAGALRFAALLGGARRAGRPRTAAARTGVATGVVPQLSGYRN